MKFNLKHRTSLLVQISAFFLVAIVLTALLSGYVLNKISYNNVEREKKNLTLGITSEVDKSIKEYRSYKSVIDYMLRHINDKFDFEYDASNKTEIKTRLFLEKHKGMEIQSVTPEEFNSFSEEDKKTFVEIVHNRWINRFDNIMASYKITFLYLLATDASCKKSTFLLNGAPKGMKRGTGLNEAYIFGVITKNTKDQAEVFKSLKNTNDRLVDSSEDYMDRYQYICKVRNQNVIAGVTLEVSDVKKSIREQSRQSISVFVGSQFIQAIICLILIYIFALRPLKKVEARVEEYAETKDAENVLKQLSKLKYRNEIGVLSKDISEMIVEIEGHMEKIKTVTAENERISAELDLAKRIQEEALPNEFPPFPERNEFDIYASMTPAKEVGGDFYDFFMVDENHLALVVADVSGKGIPAALFMMVAKSLIKNRVMLGGTPSQILEDVNERLIEGDETNMFVTVWLAVIDLRTGEGTAANAGHEHPVLRRENGSYELVKYRHSLAVAMMDGVKFMEHSFKLEPGDRVFVYTDGLPEAMNKSGEMFGTERMIEALNNSDDVNSSQLLKNIKSAVDKFVDGEAPSDDLTMLVFDYYGKKGFDINDGKS